MSFFDEGEEPRRPRPRQPAAAGPGPADQQTLMVRRGIAIGGLVVLFILLVLVVNSCRNNARERALKDYNLNVASLVQESDQLSRSLFQQLTSSRGEVLDRQTQLNQLRVTADEHVNRAKDLDVPDEMKTAQRHLQEVLEFRRDGIGRIAQRLPTALGRQGAGAAVVQIAAQMQQFLASDVIYSQRVIPGIAKGLRDGDVAGQPQPSRFLPDIDWLLPDTVSDRLGSGTGATGTNGEPAPGLHGFGLLSTSVGTTTLQPGAPTRVPAGDEIAFQVKFANQGEHPESNVRLRLTISGAGAPIRVNRTIGQVRQGAEGTVQVPLGRTPPIGRPVNIRVEVLPVPGEKKTDNNRQTYPVIFTR